MPQGKNGNKLKEPRFYLATQVRSNGLSGPLFWEGASVPPLVHGTEDYRPYLSTAAEL
ncbi:MAG: hypothetical protein HPY90_14195 [Syntrophothermus sp.]|jgi:hypothetical protein|uniref:hypothetical protein n=1 Tax=Syntrophothermus sp. TaxID=2736299 RepID=UPI00257E96C6|nr:hypothetical protein [Syntrophothermus sp.]NSW84387.1 hypothetical protein [Syntrophothermus sp.]